jgi:HEAT repeat protein
MSAAAENAENAAGAAGAAGAGEGPPAAGPYRNLWVPLLVVPAGIVMVLLCVFLFFGAIAGQERSLADNLRLVVEGGANERKQAAFQLGVQAAENQQAVNEGREPPWRAEAGFADELQSAWAGVPADDHEIRLALACLQAQQGDGRGIDHLLALLDAPDLGDDAGRLRFQALAQLGALGDPRGRDALVRHLDDPDRGLRSVAAIGLQKHPGEETVAALRGALGDPELEVRANAAISLATLGDPSGGAVLIDLLDPELYAGEHGRHKERFARARLVTESRRQAVEALGRLHRPEDRGRIEALAAGDPDLTVREAAMRVLGAWER